MPLNLANTVIAFLKDHPDEKFTARQIAEWVFQTFPEECQNKKAKSKSQSVRSDDDLIRQIQSEIGPRMMDPKKAAQIKTTEGRPRKYYFTGKSDEDEVVQAESEARQSSDASSAQPAKTQEADLYPVIASWLRAEHGLYAMRIDEKRSSNQRGPNGNKWLYPDLVGMEDLSAEWDREIKDCVKQYADKKTRLWSFEVKLLINRSNVREAYFQAVSNSSWASFGYLVAGEIQGKDTMQELRMLFALHGIGVIQLEPDEISESQIIIPARERPEIDWNTCNRLATENSDFMEFIRRVRQFYQTGDPRASDWEK
ncbi:MAG: HrgA protein [Magnetococcales bacterium]|nr:HrgA protein [Magnetococcales bacterium]